MRETALRKMRVVLSTLCIGLVSCGGGGDGDGGDDVGASAPRFYSGSTAVPISGPDVADAARFDQIMTGLLKDNDVPGATLAIAKNGRLILARAYGYADFEARQLMQPDSMFRIASVSKVLTSVAVLHLEDQGLLNIDERFLNILTEYQVPANGDVRLRDISIRNLLQHAGGWDRSISPDPSSQEIAERLGVSLPVSTADRIRYAMTRPLDFAPGTKWHYSNLGYCILGPVIEKVSGQPYELYVRDHVLLPMDVHAMSIARSGTNGRGLNEVKYYEYDGAPLADSDFPGQGKTPAPYGANMSHCPASGSWIGSAVDLTRVMTVIEGSRGPTFLSAETMNEYLADPMLPPRDPIGWWGLGIAVGPTPDAWSHGGLMPGVEALLQRTSQYTWAVLTNSWPRDGDEFAVEIHAAITDALKSGLDGSASDLYAQFPSPNLPPSSP
jgi:CubicO group peptidase (beta-lactamase class C family)